jgi:hypothetical protein
VRDLVGIGYVHCTATRVMVTDEGRAFLQQLPSGDTASPSPATGAEQDGAASASASQPAYSLAPADPATDEGASGDARSHAPPATIQRGRPIRLGGADRAGRRKTGSTSSRSPTWSSAGWRTSCGRRLDADGLGFDAARRCICISGNRRRWRKSARGSTAKRRRIRGFANWRTFDVPCRNFGPRPAENSAPKEDVHGANTLCFN